MSSPAPLLRLPVPGGRSQSGSRTPALKLGIPPSPNVRPVNQNGAPPVPELPQLQRPATSSRPTAPQLRLATPMGSNATLPEGSLQSKSRPQLQPLSISAASGNSDASGHSRTGSFTMVDGGKASGPTSAASSTYSALSFAMGLRGAQMGTPDPTSAISSYSERDGGVAMEREGSMGGILPDLEKLSLDMGRPVDVEDLDDEGWLAAGEQKRIVEIGSLGEGAGGAVTRCILKGGKTVFALKVRSHCIRNHAHY